MARPEHALRQRIQKRWTNAGLCWWSNPAPLMKGFPDTQGTLDGWAWYVEFKSEKGALDPRQLLWLQHLARIGGAIAMEVREYSEGARPYFAQFRVMLRSGEFSSYRNISSDSWLQDFVREYHGGRTAPRI